MKVVFFKLNFFLSYFLFFFLFFLNFFFFFLFFSVISFQILFIIFFNEIYCNRVFEIASHIEKKVVLRLIVVLPNHFKFLLKILKNFGDDVLDIFRVIEVEEHDALLLALDDSRNIFVERFYEVLKIFLIDRGNFRK